MCCGELEWLPLTDDDELPEVTAPEWIVDKVAHYWGMKYDGDGRELPVPFPTKDVAVLLFYCAG